MPLTPWERLLDFIFRNIELIIGGLAIIISVIVLYFPTHQKGR